MMHLWKKAKLLYDIRVVWARGRSKDVGSELAYRQAAEGAQEDEDACMGRWRPTDWVLEEFRRDYPHRFANGNSAVQGAHQRTVQRR